MGCLKAILISIFTLAVLASAVAGSPAQPATASAPVMTEELMRRLVARTLASTKEAVLSKFISGAFGISDGSGDVPALQVTMTVGDGKHAFIVPLKAGFKDIVIAFRTGTMVEAYLTDASSVLRAAVTMDPTGVRRVTNQQAAQKYQAELTILAKEAAALPPAPRRPES